MNEANHLSIIGLSYGDPWHPATWSNNPYYLFSNLKEMGYLDFAWGENSLRFHNYLARIMSAFRFTTIKKREIGHLAPRFFQSHILNKKFRRVLENNQSPEGGNNRVVLSTSSFVGLDNIPYPVYLYGDQNFYQFYKGNPDIREAISPRILQQIIDFEKRQSDRCEGIFCFSRWMKDSIVNDYGIDEKKVAVVGHGYCLPEYEDFDKREYEEPIMLCVVTNWKKKGGDIVLKAFRMVKEHLPEIQLHIVGRLPETVSLKMKNQDIIYHGFLNKNKPEELAKLISLYKKAAVFVLPSVFDPMPNITLEANYLKTPVVTSNVCGIPEQVIEGETGFIIDEFEAERYAEKILLLLNDRELRLKMGQRGRAFVEENYSWRIVINKMLEHMNLDFDYIHLDN
ncbi:MAG: hypothetical protein Kow0042_28430 [Calditrichia bacterium]